MLPHGDACLGLLDQGGAGREGFAAMRGAHRRRQGAVADLERAGPVGDGDGDDVETLGDLGRDVGQDVTGGGMGLVVQAQDPAAVVVVADVAGEGHHGTRPGVVDEGGHRLG